MKNEVSFTPYLKKKEKRDHSGIINIRVTKERKSQYFSIKESIDEKYWNKQRCEVKKSYVNSDLINKKITEKINELKSNYGQSENIQMLKTNDKNSFFTFFKSQIDFLKGRKKIGTSKTYGTSYNQLQNFVIKRGKSDLLFSEMDVLFITDFETYLLGNNITNNTSKKYISTVKKVFKQSHRMNVFQPKNDPFIMFENKRLQVKKNRLEKIDVDRIILTDIPENDILNEVRNYFLFQIFGQGLRVSDLLTLRWGNIVDGRIDFIQLKTKKNHSVSLNFTLLSILKNYIPDKCSEIYSKKYSVTFKEKEYNMNYQELKNHYKEISKKYITKFSNNDKTSIEIMVGWKNILDELTTKIKYQLTIDIHQHSKNYPKSFIFPFLKNEDFKDVKFDNETNLTLYQYNQISSKNVVYNRQLKRLQSRCEIDTVLTSHISRHTYTNILIDLTGNDIYSISKSLGHQRLSTTEHYINEFSNERTNKVNDDFNDKFSHL
ncbi:MAG: site-specific integrase [Bacteroidetes bacterium]|nr:site-specific integrase [Bacteroidota bacterium]